MRLRIPFAAAVTAACMAAGATGLVSTASAHGAYYTCKGGNFAKHIFTSIPSGTYAGIKVTGVCNIKPNAVITVVGNINVDPGAVLDAQSAPSRITVAGNVTAASGALLGLGCQPNPPGHTTGHPCTVETGGHTTITIGGNVVASNADTVLLNGNTINGSVALTGGGGAIPWSVKNNTIGANITVSDVTPNWFGMLLNTVGGNAKLTNIHITDPGDPDPTIFVVSNTVRLNLNCSGLGPNLIAGLPGEYNVVGQRALGQCAMK